MKKLIIVSGLALIVGITSYTLAGDVGTDKISYLNRTETTTEDGRTLKTRGTGFVLGDKYISLDHVVSRHHELMPTPFGMMKVPIQRTGEKTYVKNVELEEIVNDQTTDVAVFSIPEPLCKEICNKLSRKDYLLQDDLKIGQRVYWYGNPLVKGKFYRESVIGKLHSKHPDPRGNEAIGIGDNLVPGDSGSPVYDMKTGKIIGISQYVYGGLGYLMPMDDVMPYLEEKK